MSLSQTPSQGWNPYYISDRWQPSFLLNTFSVKEFMLLQSSSFYCQMTLLLRRLILTLSRMYLLRTSTPWVKFCPSKQHKWCSICHCGKWQAMSNFEGSGHSLSVGGEVEIFLSDLGRVKTLPMPEKGMNMTQKVQTKERQMPWKQKSPKSWKLIKESCIGPLVYTNIFFCGYSKIIFVWGFYAFFGWTYLEYISRSTSECQQL